MPSSRIAHAALVAAIALPPVVLSAQAPKTYTAADVAFIQGMIHHHAQAILIAGWAKSHGANASVQQLCDRIVVIAKGRVVADESPDALREQTGEANLEDAFVKLIGSEEGLAA